MSKLQLLRSENRKLKNTLPPNLGLPKCPKTEKKPICWLFWTISLTRMGLMIWLGAYLQA
jgi:hypothetical protein